MRLRPGFRGDLDDLMIRHCREPVQNILDVSVGIDSATPATRDDRVNHRATPARFVGTDEEPVLLPDCCRADRVFAQVVVDFDAPVFYEGYQHRPLRKGVMDRFAHEAFGQVTATLFKIKKDAVDTIEDGPTATLPQRLS